MRQKSPEGRPAVSLNALLFWKRRSDTSAEVAENDQSKFAENSFTRVVTQGEAMQAREELKLLEVERQILGSALTTIYESQTKGLLGNKERDYLLGKYKSELKRLEERITERQRIVELFELEESRGKIVQAFKKKLAEIETRIQKLRPDYLAAPIEIASPTPKEITFEPQEIAPEPSSEPPTIEQPKVTGEREEKETQKTKVERKLEAIREEVLKAMERLEQIEAEG